MSDYNLSRLGLYFDKDSIHIFDPSSNQTTTELITECSEFIQSTKEFKDIVDDFILIVANLKEKVEKEKIKALGSRNALESIGIQKELHRQQLVVLINEKRQELERLNSLEQSLIRDEAEQKDLIERLTNQR
ncbi:intraflagellar transport protein 20 homolog B-like [Tetranychus urticae]|uniref:Intraflagellar transport protein 20 homolog n=1 Tax=Tetranychus urticae TaxID=32264 RepID=T1JZV6_TETUR|nr:intraflagellar transport protein 20 homolog B-like [Tetranychus urticae]